MSLYSLTDNAFLPESIVTGDSEFRDAAVARSQAWNREADDLIGQIDTLLRKMREDAADCGLDDIAECAEEATTALKDWLSDYRQPLTSAVDEASGEAGMARAMRGLS